MVEQPIRDIIEHFRGLAEEAQDLARTTVMPESRDGFLDLADELFTLVGDLEAYFDDVEPSGRPPRDSRVVH